MAYLYSDCENFSEIISTLINNNQIKYELKSKDTKIDYLFQQNCSNAHYLKCNHDLFNHALEQELLDVSLPNVYLSLWVHKLNYVYALLLKECSSELESTTNGEFVDNWRKVIAGNQHAYLSLLANGANPSKAVYEGVVNQKMSFYVDNLDEVNNIIETANLLLSMDGTRYHLNYESGFNKEEEDVTNGNVSKVGELNMTSDLIPKHIYAFNQEAITTNLLLVWSKYLRWVYNHPNSLDTLYDNQTPKYILDASNFCNELITLMLNKISPQDMDKYIFSKARNNIIISIIINVCKVLNTRFGAVNGINIIPLIAKALVILSGEKNLKLEIPSSCREFDIYLVKSDNTYVKRSGMLYMSDRGKKYTCDNLLHLFDGVYSPGNAFRVSFNLFYPILKNSSYILSEVEIPSISNESPGTSSLYRFDLTTYCMLYAYSLTGMNREYPDVELSSLSSCSLINKNSTIYTDNLIILGSYLCNSDIYIGDCSIYWIIKRELHPTTWNDNIRSGWVLSIESLDRDLSNWAICGAKSIVQNGIHVSYFNISMESYHFKVVSGNPVQCIYLNDTYDSKYWKSKSTAYSRVGLTSMITSGHWELSFSDRSEYYLTFKSTIVLRYLCDWYACLDREPLSISDRENIKSHLVQSILLIVLQHPILTKLPATRFIMNMLYCSSIAITLKAGEKICGVGKFTFDTILDRLNNMYASGNITNDANTHKIVSTLENVNLPSDVIFTGNSISTNPSIYQDENVISLLQYTPILALIFFLSCIPEDFNVQYGVDCIGTYYKDMFKDDLGPNNCTILWKCQNSHIFEWISWLSQKEVDTIDIVQRNFDYYIYQCPINAKDWAAAADMIAGRTNVVWDSIGYLYNKIYPHNKLDWITCKYINNIIANASEDDSEDTDSGFLRCNYVDNDKIQNLKCDCSPDMGILPASLPVRNGVEDGVDQVIPLLWILYYLYKYNPLYAVIFENSINSQKIKVNWTGGASARLSDIALSITTTKSLDYQDAVMQMIGERNSEVSIIPDFKSWIRDESSGLLGLLCAVQFRPDCDDQSTLARYRDSEHIQYSNYSLDNGEKMYLASRELTNLDMTWIYNLLSMLTRNKYNPMLIGDSLLIAILDILSSVSRADDGSLLKSSGVPICSSNANKCSQTIDYINNILHKRSRGEVIDIGGNTSLTGYWEIVYQEVYEEYVKKPDVVFDTLAIDSLLELWVLCSDITSFIYCHFFGMLLGTSEDDKLNLNEMVYQGMVQYMCSEQLSSYLACSISFSVVGEGLFMHEPDCLVTLYRKVSKCILHNMMFVMLIHSAKLPEIEFKSLDSYLAGLSSKKVISVNTISARIVHLLGRTDINIDGESVNWDDTYVRELALSIRMILHYIKRESKYIYNYIVNDNYSELDKLIVFVIVEIHNFYYRTLGEGDIGNGIIDSLEEHLDSFRLAYVRTSAISKIVDNAINHVTISHKCLLSTPKPSYRYKTFYGKLYNNNRSTTFTVSTGRGISILSLFESLVWFENRTALISALRDTDDCSDLQNVVDIAQKFRTSGMEASSILTSRFMYGLKGCVMCKDDNDTIISLLTELMYSDKSPIFPFDLCRSVVNSFADNKVSDYLLWANYNPYRYCSLLVSNVVQDKNNLGVHKVILDEEVCQKYEIIRDVTNITVVHDFVISGEWGESDPYDNANLMLSCVNSRAKQLVYSPPTRMHGFVSETDIHVSDIAGRVASLISNNKLAYTNGEVCRYLYTNILNEINLRVCKKLCDTDSNVFGSLAAVDCGSLGYAIDHFTRGRLNITLKYEDQLVSYKSQIELLIHLSVLIGHAILRNSFILSEYLYTMSKLLLRPIVYIGHFNIYDEIISNPYYSIYSKHRILRCKIISDYLADILNSKVKLLYPKALPLNLNETIKAEGLGGSLLKGENYVVNDIFRFFTNSRYSNMLEIKHITSDSVVENKTISQIYGKFMVSSAAAASNNITQFSSTPSSVLVGCCKLDARYNTTIQLKPCKISVHIRLLEPVGMVYPNYSSCDKIYKYLIRNQDKVESLYNTSCSYILHYWRSNFTDINNHLQTTQRSINSFSLTPISHSCVAPLSNSIECIGAVGNGCVTISDVSISNHFSPRSANSSNVSDKFTKSTLGLDNQLADVNRVVCQFLDTIAKWPISNHYYIENEVAYTNQVISRYADSNVRSNVSLLDTNILTNDHVVHFLEFLLKLINYDIGKDCLVSVNGEIINYVIYDKNCLTEHPQDHHVTYSVSVNAANNANDDQVCFYKLRSQLIISSKSANNSMRWQFYNNNDLLSTILMHVSGIYNSKEIGYKNFFRNIYINEMVKHLKNHSLCKDYDIFQIYTTLLQNKTSRSYCNNVLVLDGIRMTMWHIFNGIYSSSESQNGFDQNKLESCKHILNVSQGTKKQVKLANIEISNFINNAVDASDVSRNIALTISIPLGIIVLANINGYHITIFSKNPQADTTASGHEGSNSQKGKKAEVLDQHQDMLTYTCPVDTVNVRPQNRVSEDLANKSVDNSMEEEKDDEVISNLSEFLEPPSLELISLKKDCNSDDLSVNKDSNCSTGVQEVNKLERTIGVKLIYNPAYVRFTGYWQHCDCRVLSPGVLVFKEVKAVSRLAPNLSVLYKYLHIPVTFESKFWCFPIEDYVPEWVCKFDCDSFVTNSDGSNSQVIPHMSYIVCKLAGLTTTNVAPDNHVILRVRYTSSPDNVRAYASKIFNDVGGNAMKKLLTSVNYESLVASLFPGEENMVNCNAIVEQECQRFIAGMAKSQAILFDANQVREFQFKSMLYDYIIEYILGYLSDYFYQVDRNHTDINWDRINRHKRVVYALGLKYPWVSNMVNTDLTNTREVSYELAANCGNGLELYCCIVQFLCGNVESLFDTTLPVVDIESEVYKSVISIQSKDILQYWLLTQDVVCANFLIVCIASIIVQVFSTYIDDVEDSQLLLTSLISKFIN